MYAWGCMDLGVSIATDLKLSLEYLGKRKE
jgi:hypothetical protein